MHGKARGSKLHVTYGMQVWSVFRRFLSCYEHKIDGTLGGFFYYLFSVMDASPGVSISFCLSGYLRVTVLLPQKILKFQTLADAFSCIFTSFLVALFHFFFAPKSTNLNKFEENYVTMKQSQSTISIQVLLFNTFTTGISEMVKVYCSFSSGLILKSKKKSILQRNMVIFQSHISLQKHRSNLNCM